MREQRTGVPGPQRACRGATYQAVIEAERKPELFSNAGGIRPDQPGVEMMIEMDDPQHLLRRKLVNSGFTRKRVKDLEASISSLCDTLIDAVCEKGECDFVWDLAAPLPMAVIGDMLGVRPEEREMFLKWSDDLVSSLSSTAAEADIQVTMDAFATYSNYMTGMIEERKTEPTDDLVSVLVHAEVEGSKLEDHQIVTEVLLLLIGGDETTRHTLSGGTRQLLRHPEQHQRLINDLDLLPNAIEEMLRWTAPVKNMARTITADTEFHGTALKEGEKMILLFESANFDEKIFESPSLSISSAIRTTTSPSASARTSAWGTSSPAWSFRSCRRSCCSGCPTCDWPRTRSFRCGRPTSSAAWRRCRWSSRPSSRWASWLGVSL